MHPASLRATRTNRQRLHETDYPISRGKDTAFFRIVQGKQQEKVYFVLQNIFYFSMVKTGAQRTRRGETHNGYIAPKQPAHSHCSITPPLRIKNQILFAYLKKSAYLCPQNGFVQLERYFPPPPKRSKVPRKYPKQKPTLSA